MRIMLFPKLVRDEETKTHSLKNCRVVIDGQNFFYNVYEDNKLPYVFGSEANEHAKHIRKLITMFKNANVECYIVFKGGDTTMDKKIQKLKEKNFEYKADCEFISPIFMKEVCKQVLEEAGVKYGTCVLECKDHCVRLAQALNCPVLSNDIEYCFKTAPYIPYNTLKYSHVQNGISCKIYQLKDFLYKNSLTEKKIAIFAALCDVNIFPQNHFNNLFQTWDVGNQHLYIQNKSLLRWLSINEEDEIVNNVLKFLTSDVEKERFQSQIEKVLTDMHNDGNGVVINYLLDNRKLPVSRCDPMWFEKGVAAQKIDIQYINLYKHKSILGSWAIESKDSIDSLMLSKDIIKYAYNLLNNFKTSEIIIHQNRETNIKISTECSVRRPIYQCTQSVFENGWAQIKLLKLFEHFLWENNINTEIIDQFPPEARMLFIALTYFTQKKTSENIQVTAEVYCFIISYVMLHIVLDGNKSKRKIKSGVNEKDSAEAIKATKKYFKYDENEVKQIFNVDTLKTLVELQYCLVHMNYLNTLCGSPYYTTKYHRTFNATFIYKLLHDMDGRDAYEFIVKLFQTAPSVLNFINKLISKYKVLV